MTVILRDSRHLILSIKPHFVERILTGSKTVELRRVRPRVVPGSRALLYSSSPQKALVGGFLIADLFDDSPTRLWIDVKDRAGISQSEYDAYFSGATQAVAIGICGVRVFEHPIPLDVLRARIRGFRPPQSFGYLEADEVSLLHHHDGQR